MPGEGEEAERELNQAAARHVGYLLSHLKLDASGGELRGRALKLTPPSTFGDPETTSFQYELEYPVPQPLPSEVSFRHTMLQEWMYGEGVPWNLSYILRTKNERSPETSSWLLSVNMAMPIETGWVSSSAPAPRNPEGGSARVPEIAAALVVAAIALGCGWLWRTTRTGAKEPR